MLITHINWNRWSSAISLIYGHAVWIMSKSSIVEEKKEKMSVVTVPQERYMNRILPWMLPMVPKNRYFHYYMFDSQCHYTNDKCQFCWLATRNTSIEWAHFYWFPSAFHIMQNRFNQIHNMNPFISISMRRHT